MSKYRFNIDEGAGIATLTIEATDEESAITQAQQLLKSSDVLGEPIEMTDESAST